MAGGRAAIVRRVSVEARDVLQQRRPGRRRPHDEHGEGIGPPTCFHEGLPQVQEMAACLHLAGPPQVGGLDAQAVERARARDDRVVGDDGAQLERKHVERPRELVGAQQERRGQPEVVPLGQAHRASAQVVGRERVDDDQRVDERSFVTMAMASAIADVSVFGLSCMNSVNDDRPDTGAEHLAQVVVEGSHGRWDLGHMSIM